MNKERKKLSKDYLKARKAFLVVANKDDVLKGNDNIIGRIGEAIAHSFLEQNNRKPRVIDHKSNPGFDILCDNEKTKISVKMITAENQSGRTSKIKHEWDELIGIELGKDLKVKNLGIISRKAFDKELKKRNQSLEPAFSRTMFKEKGLFNDAGKLYSKEELEIFDLI